MSPTRVLNKPQGVRGPYVVTIDRVLEKDDDFGWTLANKPLGDGVVVFRDGSVVDEAVWWEEVRGGAAVSVQ